MTEEAAKCVRSNTWQGANALEVAAMKQLLLISLMPSKEGEYQ